MGSCLRHYRSAEPRKGREESHDGEREAGQGGKGRLTSPKRISAKWRQALPGLEWAGWRAGGGLAGSMHVYGLAWMREGAVPCLARRGTWLNAHVSPQWGTGARAKALWRQGLSS